MRPPTHRQLRSRLRLALAAAALTCLDCVGGRRSRPKVSFVDPTACATKLDLPLTPTYHWKDDRALDLIRQGRAVVLLDTGLVETAEKWTLSCAALPIPQE